MSESPITPDALKLLERLTRTDGHRFPAALMNAVTNALMTGEGQLVSSFIYDPEFDRVRYSERPPFVFGTVGLLVSGSWPRSLRDPREYDELIKYLDTYAPITHETEA